MNDLESQLNMLNTTNQELSSKLTSAMSTISSLMQRISDINSSNVTASVCYQSGTIFREQFSAIVEINNTVNTACLNMVIQSNYVCGLLC